VPTAATARTSFQVNIASITEQKSLSFEAGRSDILEADLAEIIFNSKLVISDHRFYNGGSQFVMIPMSM
jgi:hypothetical protein